MNETQAKLADVISFWFGKAKEDITVATNVIIEMGLSHLDLEVLSYAIEETFLVEINPPAIRTNPLLSELSYRIHQQIDSTEVQPFTVETSLFVLLRPVIAERLEIIEDRIDIDSRLLDDFGADDLDIYELVYACEEAFEISIPDEVQQSLKTVRDLMKHVAVGRRSAKYLLGSGGKTAPVFVSYVRNDRDSVMRLVRDLQRYGIEVWLDRFEIQPGEDWKIAIRKAIEKGMFFIACFSSDYWNRQENLMNEELQIAIEKMRRMQDERIWFIPVKLNPCSIPDFEIRSGKFLDSKQWVELFNDWNEGIHRIVSVIKYRQNT